MPTIMITVKEQDDGGETRILVGGIDPSGPFGKKIVKYFTSPPFEGTTVVVTDKTFWEMHDTLGQSDAEIERARHHLVVGTNKYFESDLLPDTPR